LTPTSIIRIGSYRVWPPQLAVIAQEELTPGPLGGACERSSAMKKGKKDEKKGPKKGK
jgi:hypothetical protein